MSLSNEEDMALFYFFLNTPHRIDLYQLQMSFVSRPNEKQHDLVLL